MIRNWRCRSHDVGGHHVKQSREALRRDEHAAIGALYVPSLDKRPECPWVERSDGSRIALRVRLEHLQLESGERVGNRGHARQPTSRIDPSWCACTKALKALSQAGAPPEQAHQGPPKASKKP